MIESEKERERVIEAKRENEEAEKLVFDVYVICSLVCY